MPKTEQEIKQQQTPAINIPSASQNNTQASSPSVSSLEYVREEEETTSTTAEGKKEKRKKSTISVKVKFSPSAPQLKDNMEDTLRVIPPPPNSYETEIHNHTSVKTQRTYDPQELLTVPKFDIHKQQQTNEPLTYQQFLLSSKHAFYSNYLFKNPKISKKNLALWTALLFIPFISFGAAEGSGECGHNTAPQKMATAAGLSALEANFFVYLYYLNSFAYYLSDGQFKDSFNPNITPWPLIITNILLIPSAVIQSVAGPIANAFGQSTGALTIREKIQDILTFFASVGLSIKSSLNLSNKAQQPFALASLLRTCEKLRRKLLVKNAEEQVALLKECIDSFTTEKLEEGSFSLYVNYLTSLLAEENRTNENKIHLASAALMNPDIIATNDALSIMIKMLEATKTEFEPDLRGAATMSCNGILYTIGTAASWVGVPYTIYYGWNLLFLLFCSTETAQIAALTFTVIGMATKSPLYATSMEAARVLAENLLTYIKMYWKRPLSHKITLLIPLALFVGSLYSGECYKNAAKDQNDFLYKLLKDILNTLGVPAWLIEAYDVSSEWVGYVGATTVNGTSVAFATFPLTTILTEIFRYAFRNEPDHIAGENDLAKVISVLKSRISVAAKIEPESRKVLSPYLEKNGWSLAEPKSKQKSQVDETTPLIADETTPLIANATSQKSKSWLTRATEFVAEYVPICP